MVEMFEAPWHRLAVAVFVILVLFDCLLPVTSPGAGLDRIGARGALGRGHDSLLHRTTLNIESFMGSIMCLGVSVSNSVMLVTFMTDHWKDGNPAAEAAVIGASDRLRPILMTACAMTAGWCRWRWPWKRAADAGAAWPGSDRGLVMSTVATLLAVPSIFALVMGRSRARTPSIYPNDPREPALRPPGLCARGRSGPCSC